MQHFYLNNYFIFLGKIEMNSLRVNSLNIFKHNVKKHYLTWITHNLFMWICVSVFIYVFMSVGVCIHTYVYILVYFPLTYSYSRCCCWCCCWVSFFFFCSLTLFSYFCSYLGGHNENKVFLPVLCYPSHCWCYSFLSALIFQLQFLNFNF